MPKKVSSSSCKNYSKNWGNMRRLYFFNIEPMLNETVYWLFGRLIEICAEGSLETRKPTEIARNTI